MEELASEEEAATVMGEGESGSPLKATGEARNKEAWTVKQEAQCPAGATLAKPPPRPLMRQEGEAAMGRKPQQGRGFPAGRKIRPASPK